MTEGRRGSAVRSQRADVARLVGRSSGVSALLRKGESKCLVSTPTSLVLAVLREADAITDTTSTVVATDLFVTAVSAPTRTAAVDACAELLDTALGYGTAGSDTTRELAGLVVDAVRKET